MVPLSCLYLYAAPASSTLRFLLRALAHVPSFSQGSCAVLTASQIPNEFMWSEPYNAAKRRFARQT